jgi:hypothetical protein
MRIIATIRVVCAFQTRSLICMEEKKPDMRGMGFEPTNTFVTGS